MITKPLYRVLRVRGQVGTDTRQVVRVVVMHIAEHRSFPVVPVLGPGLEEVPPGERAAQRVAIAEVAPGLPSE